VSHRFVDLQVPVTCGDAAVYPGDIIVGDSDGVIVVPAALAEVVATAAQELEMKEKFIIGKIRSGSPVYGTYPLEQPLLDEFTAWRAEQ
jgi:regulator of RNase E activity RraA